MAKHHEYRLPPALDFPYVVQPDEDDPRTSREAPLPERPDPGEELLRSSFETFLDLRRRALTPTRGHPAGRHVAPGLETPSSCSGSWSTRRLGLEALQLEALVNWTRAGSTPGEAAPGSDEMFKRSFLASVVGMGLVVLPELRGELCAGLRALDQGEVQPLLAPARGGRLADPYTLAQLRLVGLLHAHLRWGRGEKKASAVADCSPGCPGPRCRTCASGSRAGSPISWAATSGAWRWPGAPASSPGGSRAACRTSTAVTGGFSPTSSGSGRSRGWPRSTGA